MNEYSPTFTQIVHSGSFFSILGTPNTYTALMAKAMGWNAIYLSGSALSCSQGLPDLGLISFEEILQAALKITSHVDLPLLVDCDTGFENPLTARLALEKLHFARVQAIHIEDQVPLKRCGHRPLKHLISPEEMKSKIAFTKAEAIKQNIFLIVRTDALQNEGIEGALTRIEGYLQAGADAIFLEGVKSIEEIHAYHKVFSAPLLINVTEFGISPLFTQNELQSANVSMALYPLTLFRLMNKAAYEGIQTILKEGSQLSLLDKMQTREEMYRFIDYEHYEENANKYLEEKASQQEGDH